MSMTIAYDRIERSHNNGIAVKVSEWEIRAHHEPAMPENVDVVGKGRWQRVRHGVAVTSLETWYAIAD